MYKVQSAIRGTSPLLQHAFTKVAVASLMEGSKKQTGSPDYSLEWMETMYANADGLLCQPANHIEGALVKAAASFKVKGKGGKSWKDAIRAYCYVMPDEIPHIWNGAYVTAPTADLLIHPTDNLCVNIMRVVVQRSAVARSRLMLATGWELAFTMEIIEDQLRPDVLQAVLNEAGRAVGIGDFRPRYGRFETIRFTVE